MKLHSYTITQGRDRAPARAMLKAIGFTDEDLKKPIIGVANTWIETMPCNYNLRELAEHVKAGIRAAGGTPMEFNTIAISDGVTMGTEGMKASLVSRDLIADSIELVARGHMFDGIVALVACDKTIPGAAMALLRLNIPGVVLYGGSIMPGHYQGPRSYGAGCVRSRRRERSRQDRRCGVARDRKCGVSRRRSLRRPVHGQHHGDRDGDDRPVADEYRIGATSRPAQAAGRVSMRAGRDGRGAGRICGLAISPRARRSKTRSRRWPQPAARPMQCCICSPWRARRESNCRSTISRPSAQRTPLLVDLKPAGRFVAVDVDNAGGMAVVAKRLADGGYAHGSAMTVTGRTFG